MLGVLYAERGDFPEAENVLCDALDSSNAGAQFNYGKKLALQRFDDAFRFRQSTGAEPDVGRGQLNRGNILLSRKSVEGAIACFDAAIRVSAELR